jgi:hypothetical protein
MLARYIFLLTHVLMGLQDNVEIDTAGPWYLQAHGSKEAAIEEKIANSQCTEFSAVLWMLGSFSPQCSQLSLKTCHLSINLKFSLPIKFK